jgi:LysR family transcriptional regulator, nitrogen assimilation regulatory protein
MDERKLRYFQAVAEFGSYSRGAEFLRISQPAVSRQIRALEQELGLPLFIRHSHGVSLTDAGRILLERGQAISRQWDHVRDDLRRGQEGLSGTVTIAVPPAAGCFLIPELARRLATTHPNISLNIAAGFSGYIHEWLLHGRVDLACLHDPQPLPGFSVTPLVREEVFLVGKRGAVVPPHVYVRARDLARLPLILPSRRLLDGWLVGNAAGLDIRMEVDDHLIIRALIRDGLGFSLLTRGAFLAELASGELAAWPLRPRAFWSLTLMEAPEDRRTPPVTALADLIRATARDLVRRDSWPGGSRHDAAL